MKIRVKNIYGNSKDRPCGCVFYEGETNGTAEYSIIWVTRNTKLVSLTDYFMVDTRVGDIESQIVNKLRAE